MSTGNQHVFGDEVETIVVQYDGSGVITTVTSTQFPSGLPGNQVTWGGLPYVVGGPMPRRCVEGRCLHSSVMAIAEKAS